ncbi:MAG: helix-turn-helix domain-containing protein [Synergistaceae bacterium]|nr:helix-turn-helix domain-containing protein [Synergistaceae bacterium]
MSDKYYTVADVAKILGLTEYTVRKKIREGQLDALKGASDRDGYKIPVEALTKYLSEEKHIGISDLGFAALPVIAGVGLGIAGLIGGMVRSNAKSKNKKDLKKIRDLSIESLRDEIEATQYYIQALELDGEEITKENQKRILESKAKIKTLERQIKEIQIKYELE